MSCLTRKLQQNLTRYLKKNRESIEHLPLEAVRNDLVDKGLCPSCVTKDQMRNILQSATQD